MHGGARVPELVPAGHQGGTGAAADGATAVPGCEDLATVCEGVDVWRLRCRVARETHLRACGWM